MPDRYKQIKWQRWNIATHHQGSVKPDFRPKNFMKVMKFEIILVVGGICMGLMLPNLLRAKNAQRAGADYRT